MATLVMGQDGCTSKNGSSAEVSTNTDRERFLKRRREFDVIIIGGNTARSERYAITPCPLVVISRHKSNVLITNPNAVWWNLDPKEALEKMIMFTWDYYLKNPEFITLVNSENLHRAEHLKNSEAVKVYNRRFVSMVKTILDRGVAAGLFRDGIDPVQLNITIAAIGYYYLTNRFTGSVMYERDLMAKNALEERLKFNIETIMRLVSAS